MNIITKYSKEELAIFQGLLQDKLDKNLSQIDSLESQLLDITDNGKDENSIENTGYSMQLSSLMNSIDRLKKHQAMIRNAILRINNNVYGICAETGKLIDEKRLMAVPTTTLSIEGKKLRNQKTNQL